MPEVCKGALRPYFLTLIVVLQAKEDRQEHEAQIGKAQMAAALQGGASWGFGEDAPLEDPTLVRQPVDWREYAETKGLTEKQVRSLVLTRGDIAVVLGPDETSSCHLNEVAS